MQALYTLTGKVITGAGYGRRLGFPTANLDAEHYRNEKLDIPLGIYAGTAEILGIRKTYRAGIVIGPLDAAGVPKIEAHLLDFSGDLYGKELHLSLLRFLRPFQKFDNESSLKSKIAADLLAVRKLVALDEATR